MAANKKISTAVSRKLFDEAKAMSMLRGITLEAFVRAAIEDYTERCIANPRGDKVNSPCHCGDMLEAVISCGQGIEPVYQASSEGEDENIRLS